MWESQWELFAPDFREGKAHIDLSPYGCLQILELYPGPGFGDFSHPTTQLTLTLMSSLISQKLTSSSNGSAFQSDPFSYSHSLIQEVKYSTRRHIIDIGCGSGILSLAAAHMVGGTINGFDIDPQAVHHARENTSLYKGLIKPSFQTYPPKVISHPTLLLMNMIQIEQQQAWASLSPYLKNPAVLISSGILVENQKSYLQWAQKKGWKLHEKSEQEGWNAFVFTTSTDKLL